MNFIFPVYIFLFLMSGFYLSSCEEDATTLGKGLLPGSDFVNINSIDTLHPVSYTMYDAAVKSGNLSATYLGNIYDPLFGTTSASFATQLRLKYDWPGGKTWYYDSLKLVLQFESNVGGATGTNTLNIYEIDKQLYTDSTYYSNAELPLTGFSLTGIPLPALKPDSVNQVELKLPLGDFTSRILRDTAMLFHSNTVPDFRSYFKGLYFTISSTSATDPLLVSINLANTSSSYDGYYIIDRYYKNFFVLYMHDFDGHKLSYYFMIDAVNDNASINKYSHNFPELLAGRIGANYRDSLTYQQALSGVYTKIVIPGLADLKKSGNFSNVAVNKARLTIPFYSDEGQYKHKLLPKQLLLAYKTSTGKYRVPDLNLGDNGSYFDGVIDTVKNVYNFNIATYVQKYLEDQTGELRPELEIVQNSGTQNLIFRGNSNSKKTTFALTYTEY
ncbi:MAG TPA: DUF4270 family protein [Bacteroidales bacterium]|nr:DUF4270 family protein [Bacteroidales bacterium]